MRTIRIVTIALATLAVAAVIGALSIGGKWQIQVTQHISAPADEIFPFVRIPLEININAKAGLSQPLLSTYNIEFDIYIKSENTFEKIWKFPTYVGMSVGRSLIIGTIEWTDNDGNHELELNGIGSHWSMRALL